MPEGHEVMRAMVGDGAGDDFNVGVDKYNLTHRAPYPPILSLTPNP